MLAGPACTNFAALPGLLRRVGSSMNEKHAVAHFQKRLKNKFAAIKCPNPGVTGNRRAIGQI